MNIRHRNILIGVLIVIILGIYFSANLKRTDVVNEPVTNTKEFDGRNASFSIDGKQIKLVNGIAEEPAAPGSASKITTRYFGNEAVGDLNGDNLPDRAFLVSQDSGGSGLFYYAVVAVQTEGGFKTTNAFFVGDRISPQSTYIPQNSQELQINYAERAPGEPMTTPPSRGATLLLKVTPQGVLEGLMR